MLEKGVNLLRSLTGSMDHCKNCELPSNMIVKGNDFNGDNGPNVDGLMAFNFDKNICALAGISHQREENSTNMSLYSSEYFVMTTSPNYIQKAVYVEPGHEGGDNSLENIESYQSPAMSKPLRLQKEIDNGRHKMQVTQNAKTETYFRACPDSLQQLARRFIMDSKTQLSEYTIVQPRTAMNVGKKRKRDKLLVKFNFKKSKQINCQTNPVDAIHSEIDPFWLGWDEE